ncbi:MAG: hypothetical protein HFF17_09935 [Oscillospiraceae bacterium]|nr:hypothetical protein [Oscillospiraceae bacterium]
MRQARASFLPSGYGEFIQETAGKAQHSRAQRLVSHEKPKKNSEIVKK